ncbi:DNA polymerase I, partial [candidate division KSB1 bacterium]
MSRKRLFLVDGTALAYRSYFAFIGNPLINSKGENTSAIFGFTNSILKIIRDESPDYIGIVFDTGKPTFRHKKYPEYKATREKMPDEMKDQLPKIKEIIDAFNIPVIEVDGFEADDVMGTLAFKALKENLDVYLVTGDKDFMQLLKPGVFIYNVKKGGKELEILDKKGVINKIGIPPERIIDLLALMGDKSDNVPGIPGIGEKTAIKLLKEFGTLDNILNNKNNIKHKSLKEKIDKNESLAVLSKELVTIDTNVPVSFEPEKLKKGEYNRTKLVQLFKDFEFTSLMDEIPEENIESEVKYTIINNEKELKKLVKALSKNTFSFDLETTSSQPMLADIVGFSFCYNEKEAFYIPVMSKEKECCLETGLVLSYLKHVFENKSIKKIGQNAKFDIIILRKNGIDVKGLNFDTMVASYLLNPGKRQHNLDAISMEYLNYRKISIKSLIGERKKQISMSEVPLKEIARYACEDADITLRLKNVLYPLLKRQGLLKLYEKVEMPLIEVLIEMEMNGVSIDVPFLKKMSSQLNDGLKKLEKEIFLMAGEEFNINSPQQLGKILFEKLEIHKEIGLKRAKKTKSGYSTDVVTLEKLKHLPLPRAILTYRTLMKLKSTYVDALPKLINPQTGKIHTSFNQTVTATGRLSSSDPNLQNIPVRTEVGREIRKAFIPSSSNCSILSADYSQIELRLMAHLSQDKTLMDSFRAGEDIHKRTASLIFDIP